MGANSSTSNPNYSIQEASQAHLIKFFVNIDTFDSIATPFALQFSGSSNYRFYDSYNLEFGALQEDKREKLIFSIIKLNTVDSLEQNITEYYSFEDAEVGIQEQGIVDVSNDLRLYRLIYSSDEEQFLNNLYGSEEPNFDFTLVPSTPNDLQQSSIPPLLAEYSSISSLGPISSETLTISTVTGSATGLITSQVETITDIGGVLARGRRDETGVITTTTGVGSAATTRTVRTSGY